MSNYLSRRRFISESARKGIAVSAGYLLGRSGEIAAQTGDDADIPDVAVVNGDPEKAVAGAFEMLGGIEKFIRPKDMVLLKPNISFPNPSHFGSTTNPAIVRIVAELALKAGASRVIVADNTMQNSELCFKKTGMLEEIMKVNKAKIIALDRETLFSEITVPGGKALEKIKVAKLIEKCDVFINLPCAKSHAATQVSFGLKNLMGLVWDRTYFHTGTDLHTAIADLATVIKPDITILDATRALLTNGPTGPGKVREMNTVIAGTNPLAVDVYASSIAPWNNRSVNAVSVKHLALAAEKGLGEIDVKKLVVVKQDEARKSKKKLNEAK